MELKNIFYQKITQSGWTCEEDKLIDFFESNKNRFSYFGGDMETLLHKCKTAYSKRIINTMDTSCRKKLLMEDIEEGYILFNENSLSDSENKEKSGVLEGFYI